MKIGREANKINHPFFYLKDAELFDEAIRICKKYGISFLFVEDIDEIGSGEARDKHMNKILNTLDGVEIKGSQVTVIFTTNHAKKINPALRRPGRIDSIINFDNPNKETRVKIMKKKFSHLFGAESLNYDYLATEMGDLSGSLVAEICSRSIEFCEDEAGISDEIIQTAIASMQYHIDFMNDKVEGEPKEMTFISLFRELMGTYNLQEFIKANNFNWSNLEKVRNSTITAATTNTNQ
jgi:SpoVK/Ycf46/Vps4 family AAA+-type ATPase